MALVGLGAFVAIRWLLRGRHGAALVAGALGSVLVVGSLGYVLVDGVAEPLGERDEPVGEPAGAHLARRRERGGRCGRRAGERARRELRRHRRSCHRDEHRVRVGEDLHERLPHRAAGRGDRALGHLPRHARELPRGRAHDLDARAARATPTPRPGIGARHSGARRPCATPTTSWPTTSSRGSRSSPSRRSCS